MKKRNDKSMCYTLQTALLALCILLSGCAGETDNGRNQEIEGMQGMITGSEETEAALVESKDGLTRMLTTAVQIRAGGLSGSGVIYEEAEDGLVIMTAGHVMADTKREVAVTFYDGYEVTCQEFWLFPEVDCAFLMVPYKELPQEWASQYMAVQKDRLTFDTIERESGVFLSDPENENEFGYRFALLMENWIYVEDFGQYMMILSGDVEAGMSGCGVFDEFGCFLGILCGENESGELAVMPYSVLDAAYTRIK